MLKRSKPGLAEVAGVGACWIKNVSVFAFGDGRLNVGGKTFKPHDGDIVGCIAAPDGERAITAGSDGCIIATDASGVSQTLFERANAFIDVLVAHVETNRLAFSCGKHVLLMSLTDPTSCTTFTPSRAPNSIALCQDGDLLAIGHSGGVSLFRTDEPSEAWLEFPCGGGPVSVALNPSGGFLFAGLSEPALAGWRIGDGQGFRMGGYPGKPKQLVWTDNGAVLLTSGGPALLAWPMQSPDGKITQGPIGQAAGVFRPRLGMVTAIASHGKIASIGWSDGGIDVVDLQSGQFKHVGGPKPKANLDQDPRALTTAIISVGFRSDGRQVAWIGENGKYGSASVQ